MTEYEVIFTDRAEAELQQAYLRVGQASMQVAESWYAGFQRAIASLSALPNRCPPARENPDYPTITVRRLLYGKHRVLFHVIEPQADDARGMVRVLRILHGAQETEPQEDLC